MTYHFYVETLSELTEQKKNGGRARLARGWPKNTNFQFEHSNKL